MERVGLMYLFFTSAVWQIFNRQSNTFFSFQWDDCDTIAVILLVLWLLGLATSYTVGGFIHVLLVLAVVMVLLRVLSGRRAV